MTTLKIRGFKIALKYLHRPRNRSIWHYRRRVPKDLRQFYNAPHILRSLKTSDDAQAIKHLEFVNEDVEKEFMRLRMGLPKVKSGGAYKDGLNLLSQHGLAQGDFHRDSPEVEQKKDEFYDSLNDQVRAKLGYEKYKEWYFSPYKEVESVLPEKERSAFQLLKNEFSLTASDFPEEYIRLKDKEGDSKFVGQIENAMGFLLRHLPDKRPSAYRRSDVRALIEAGKLENLKTRSIQRHLSSIRAMFNKVSLELELKPDREHPFTDFDIPHLGMDSISRTDFSYDELQKLRDAKPKRSEAIVWLIHLMMETGMRVNECCGIRIEDIKLQDEYPHVILHRNTFRRLKTKNSQRFVPLVGVAFEAARQAIIGSTSDWLLPAYIDLADQKTKNKSASAATNKFIKSTLVDSRSTCHSFRHTMSTRLREVGCPKSIVDELSGWSKGVSESYGSSADLKNKTKYLKSAVEAQHRTEI